MQSIKVWDLPIRVFHWALVLLILAAWLTQEFDRMEWHVWVGYAILTLLLFRFIWGLVGSDTARFGRFLKSPVAAVRHLSHILRRDSDLEVGHNAAGGWMVLAMLALIGLQAITGLFSNDDGNTEGPLMHLVSKDRSNWLSKIHSLNFDLIEIVIVLHVLAIATYAVLKRQDLVRPMITGRKVMPPGTMAPRLASPLLATYIFAAAAALVTGIVWL